MTTNNGGPAFPTTGLTTEAYHAGVAGPGMTLRDWFAGQVQADDRLVKCIRSMDDKALEIFAIHPEIEREEHITEVDLTCWEALGSEVAKVTRRLELEAMAIARVRFMQADAMLAAREKQP